MNRDEAIAISDDEDDAYVSRRAILEPVIKNVVDALGGYEDGRYRLGDECYGCLKDLKRLWRKDDTDDERTVARIFWETRVLPNDLIPIFLETAGKGLFEDKRAVACADLMTAMTWPIDIAEELKELDDERDKGTDYTQLMQSHLHYKAALLKSGIMEALLGVILPCLARGVKERTEKDVQIVGVVLYLVRNLAFIKDLPPNMNASADQAQFSSLQSKLVKALSESHILDLLLTIASNTEENPMFNGWNTIVLEIFYLLLRGVKPESLSSDQSKESTQTLRRLLAVEDKRKRDITRNSASRHSRFGTTIAVTLNPKNKANQAQHPAGGNHVNIQPESDEGASSQAFILHRQQALKREAGSMFDMLPTKRPERFRGAKKVDEVSIAGGDNLNVEARQMLQGLASSFLEACFNPFLAMLLKDIQAERPKITEQDHLRLLYLTKWILQYFICQRQSANNDSFNFGLVAEVTERQWIIWVLKRMRQAVEAKPKLWTELQAGVECLTQLVQLIECMVNSGDPTVTSTADLLQSQLVYNGEVLDVTLESLKMYRPGTQSLAYLESSVNLAYFLLRRLEKHVTKEGGNYVRRKAKRKRAKKAEEDGVPDVEDIADESSEDEMPETMFTFDQFESRFAHSDVTQTLLAYVARYQEYASAENMKRIVSLLHRQAIRAKAEGLFFRVSTLELFKDILEDKSLPREQPYKDLTNLMNFLLRKFFKAVAEDSFLIVEAFYPKNRSKWKAYSSWQPPEKGGVPGDTSDASPANKWPQDVRVKKGYTWTQQLGIAVLALVEGGKMTLVEWVKQILHIVASERQRIVEDTDGAPSQTSDLDDENEDARRSADVRKASMEAIAKFTDYMIPYVNDEQADAVTKDPQLKLLFRLLNFAVLAEDSEELEWYVPQAIVPHELQRNFRLINEYLEHPIDLEGKKATQLLHKKPRHRRRRRAAVSSDDEADPEDDEPRRKRKEKKKKEVNLYRSAQFIEDSDMEEEEMQAFLAREKALREKMALASAASGQIATMKSTGTKKRRKRENGKGKKKRKVDDSDQENPDQGTENPAESDKDSDSSADSDAALFNPFASPKAGPSTAHTSPESDIPDRPAPKPRPRPRIRAKAASTGSEADDLTGSLPPSSPAQSSDTSSAGSRPASPLEISDDDDTPARTPVRKKKPLFFSDEE